LKTHVAIVYILALWNNKAYFNMSIVSLHVFHISTQKADSISLESLDSGAKTFTTTLYSTPEVLEVWLQTLDMEKLIL
jgi:hypothetical protein